MSGVGVEHFPDAITGSVKIEMEGEPPGDQQHAVSATKEFCMKHGGQVLDALFKRNKKRYEVLLVRLQWTLEKKVFLGVYQQSKRINFTWDYAMPGCESRT